MIAAMLSPIWVIGTYDEYGKPNIMAASWCGVVSTSPYCIGVSLKTRSFSAENIIRTNAFSVCIPSSRDCAAIDIIGTTSGRNTDKFELTGLTAIGTTNTDAPFVKEFHINIGCKLIKSVELGSHTLYIGEVTEQQISPSVMAGDKIDISLVSPITSAAADRRYFALGSPISEIARYKK